MLGMSPMTLYRAIMPGEFPAARIRGRLIVPAQAIDAMAKAVVPRSRGPSDRIRATAGGPEMSLTNVPITVQIDAALDRVQQHRERTMADAHGSERCMRVEARLWAVLFEHSRIRVYWRAALAAESHSRWLARHWRRRAEMEARGVPTSARFGGCVEIPEWVERWQAKLAGGAS